MEKRSTPNKTAKYVLVFILIAAAAAVLIFSLVNNNKPAQSKAYGESYAAALIADIQGSSAVEYTVKRDSFDHSSVWVLGTESRLQSAKFSPKATLIPAESDADEAVQSIILSMALKEVQLLGTDESASVPGGQLGYAHALYRQRKRHGNRVRHCLRHASPENTRRAGRRLSPSPLRCRCDSNGCAAWDGWRMML